VNDDQIGPNVIMPVKTGGALVQPCKSAPVTGRRRCRMHGGAAGSGAPTGARNGNYRHGRYTKEIAATRRWLREAAHMLRELNKDSG
jgi:hypothetical protein